MLVSPGSRVKPDKVTEIKIYKVLLGSSGSPNTTGNQDGTGNTNASIWVYSAGGGPTVDGANLNFRMKPGTSDGYPACTRSNGSPVHSIGVSLQYTYDLVSPLPSVLRFFGGGPTSIQITDRTIMAMNPS